VSPLPFFPRKVLRRRRLAAGSLLAHARIPFPFARPLHLVARSQLRRAASGDAPSSNYRPFDLSGNLGRSDSVPVSDIFSLLRSNDTAMARQLQRQKRRWHPRRLLEVLALSSGSVGRTNRGDVFWPLALHLYLLSAEFQR